MAARSSSAELASPGGCGVRNGEKGEKKGGRWRMTRGSHLSATRATDGLASLDGPGVGGLTETSGCFGELSDEIRGVRKTSPARLRPNAGLGFSLFFSIYLTPIYKNDSNLNPTQIKSK
jgi:hypothetical protein